MQRSKVIFLLGMTRLEFIITVCIFLLAIYFFLNKTYQIWIETERLTFQQIVNTFRMSLYYAVIKSREGYTKIPEHCINPMAFVANPPYNYLDISGKPAGSPELDGQWYFDRQHCQLNYQWRFISPLDRFKAGPAITCFAVNSAPATKGGKNKKSFIIKEVDCSSQLKLGN